MLESRPIVQKSLAGAGAFMFVFAAAMAGTGVMISGGIGLPHHDASADRIGAATAPADWNFSETDADAQPVQAVAYTPQQPQRIDAAIVQPPAQSDASFAGQVQTAPHAAPAYEPEGDDPSADDSAYDDTGDETQTDDADDPDAYKKN